MPENKPFQFHQSDLGKDYGAVPVGNPRDFSDDAGVQEQELHVDPQTGRAVYKQAAVQTPGGASLAGPAPQFSHAKPVVAGMAGSQKPGPVQYAAQKQLTAEEMKAMADAMIASMANAGQGPSAVEPVLQRSGAAPHWLQQYAKSEGIEKTPYAVAVDDRANEDSHMSNYKPKKKKKADDEDDDY